MAGRITLDAWDEGDISAAASGTYDLILRGLTGGLATVDDTGAVKDWLDAYPPVLVVDQAADRTFANADNRKAFFTDGLRTYTIPDDLVEGWSCDVINMPGSISEFAVSGGATIVSGTPGAFKMTGDASRAHLIHYGGGVVYVLSDDLTSLEVPQTIPGLVCWLDFDDEDSITKDASNFISLIADKSQSARAYDHGQASAVDQPLWLPGGFNGRNCAQFVGDLLNYGADSAADGLPQLIDTGDWTSMCIFRGDGNHVNKAVLAQRRSGSVIKQGFLLDSSDRIKIESAGTTYSVTQQVWQDPSVWIFRRAGTTLTAWRNGVLKKTQAGVNISTDSGVVNSDVGSSGFNGLVGEVCWWDVAISDQAIATVSTYGVGKFGITS